MRQQMSMYVVVGIRYVNSLIIINPMVTITVQLLHLISAGAELLGRVIS